MKPGLISRPWRAPAGGAPSPRRSERGTIDSGSSGERGTIDRGSGQRGTIERSRPRLALPPQRMPLRQGRRPLKQWCYVGAFGEDLMLCAATASMGGVPQSFWAVWDRHRGLLDTETLLVRTGRVAVTPHRVQVRSGSARLELAVSPVGEPIEVVSPHGGSYIWTRKIPIRVDGHFTDGMEARAVSGLGILDESAGYHARQTAWEWSAGIGSTVDGYPVAWNLVRGIHDAPDNSERTVWIHGRPSEVPSVRFSSDLDEIWGSDGTVLRFIEEASRERRDNLRIVRSDYIQPFGRFYGQLPGGVELSEDSPSLGVMERHRAVW